MYNRTIGKRKKNYINLVKTQGEISKIKKEVSINIDFDTLTSWLFDFLLKWSLIKRWHHAIRHTEWVYNQCKQMEEAITIILRDVICLYYQVRYQVCYCDDGDSRSFIPPFTPKNKRLRKCVKSCGVIAKDTQQSSNVLMVIVYFIGLFCCLCDFCRSDIFVTNQIVKGGNDDVYTMANNFFSSTSTSFWHISYVHTSLLFLWH